MRKTLSGMTSIKRQVSPIVTHILGVVRFHPTLASTHTMTNCLKTVLVSTRKNFLWIVSENLLTNADLRHSLLQTMQTYQID